MRKILIVGSGSLSLLGRRVDWCNPGLAGIAFPEGDAKAQLAAYFSLRRGWFFGSGHFREQLLKLLARWPVRIEKANGYHGPQAQRLAEKRARALIRAVLERFWPRFGDPAAGLQGRLAQRAVERRRSRRKR